MLMRGQSAIEFLTTYSWAFLILGIFVSAVALLSLSTNQGVMTFVPSSCYVSPSLPCSQAIVSGNSMGSTFIVILQNNMGVKIHFPANSMRVTPSVYASNTYSGTCLPQNTLAGSMFVCSAALGNFNPSVGSQLNPTFSLSYQICAPSCTAQVYNTSGAALTAMTPYRAIVSNVVLLASPSTGNIAMGGVRYSSGANVFLITGIGYPISALPPSGYGFSTWIATANLIVGNTILASTTLTATGSGTLTANFVTVTTSISTTTTIAPWYGSSWGYRASHVINSATGAGTNYDVQITVNYGSGANSGSTAYCNNNCRTDFGDVRFTKSDGITPINYWIQSVNTGSSAIFWVQIPDNLGTGSSTIYMYYGNSGVTTTSNGAATFLLFDDASTSGAVNSITWYTHVRNGGAISVTGGEILHQDDINWAGENHYTKSYTFSTTDTYAFDFQIRYPTAYCNGGDNHNIFFFKEGGESWVDSNYDSPSGNVGSISLTTSDCKTFTTGWEVHVYGTTGTYDLILMYGNQYIPNVIGGSITGWGSVQNGYSVDFNSGTYGGQNTYWDNMFFRKYVSPEPTQGIWGS